MGLPVMVDYSLHSVTRHVIKQILNSVAGDTTS